MVARFRYFAGMEQHSPSRLLEYAALAEDAGFDSIACSDHFHPWVHTNANAGFAWVWIAGAAERTRRAKIGTGVTAPTFRYHPAIVAQAFATLGVMYPGRIFLILGSGEPLNEVPLGYDWPGRRERIERFEESINVIKRLWVEDFVTFKGKYYRLKKANLYTKPEKPIPLHIAAHDREVVELAGRHGDGFLSQFASLEHCKNVVFPALRRGAKAAGRDPAAIEKAVHMIVSYDEDYDAALAACKHWAGVTLPVFYKYGESDPREIEAHGKLVAKEELAKKWVISSDPDEHIRRIEEYLRIGFTDVQIHNISPDERKFIQVYGERVLPYLKERFKD